MRNLKKLLAVIVSVCVLATFALPAFAAETTTLTDAQISEKLGAVKGDTSQGVTEEYLAKGTTRLQAAIIYLRMLNLEEEALAFESEDNFADAADVAWAGGRAILAYLKANPELGWQGVSETTFEPNGAASAQMMYKVALEALGYKQGTDFEWADVFTFAEDKGLGKAADLAELTNNDMCTIVVEMLGIKVKDGDVTLIEKLVADGVIDEADAIEVGLIAATPDELEIEEVSATNLKQAVVTFNQKVDKDTATDKDNYKFATADKIKIKEAGLQDDGVTVVLTFEDGATAKQQQKAKLTVSNVKSAEGVKMEKTTEEVSFLDSTIPEIVEAVVVGISSIKVTFSEPMEEASIENVKHYKVNDGKYYVRNATAQKNNTEVIVEIYTSLKDGDLPFEVKVGPVDYAGFTAMGLTTTLKVVEDKEAPYVVSYKDAKPNSVTLIWNEDIQVLKTAAENYYHTNSKNQINGPLDAVEDIDGNEMKLRFDDDSKLPNGTAYVYVLKEAVQDLWKNKNAQQMTALDVVADKDAPVLQSIEVKAENQIVLTFDEDVEEASAKKRANYTILDKDGKELNVFKNATVKDKKVTVNFTKDLDGGEYTIVVEDIKDLAGNEMTSASMSFTITDFKAPSGFTAKLYLEKDNLGNVIDQIIKVNFGEEMAVGGTYGIDDLAKYVLNDGSAAGKAIEDIDDVAIAVVDDGKAVEITVPKAEYTVPTGAGKLIVARVADVAGNYTAALQTAVTISSADYITVEKAELTGAKEIKVYFSDLLDVIEEDEVVFNGLPTGATRSSIEYGTDKGKTVLTYTFDKELPYDATGLTVGTKTGANETANRYGETLISNQTPAKAVTDKLAPAVAKFNDTDKDDVVVKLTDRADDDAKYESTITITFAEDLDDDYISYGSFEVSGFKVKSIAPEGDDAVKIVVEDDHLYVDTDTAISLKSPIRDTEGNETTELETAVKRYDSANVDAKVAAIGGTFTAKGNVGEVVMPSVPFGYTIEVKSTDKPEFYDADGKIVAAGTSTVVYTVTETATGLTADTGNVTVTVTLNSNDAGVTGIEVDGVAATLNVDEYDVELPAETVLADLTADDVVVTATDAGATVAPATTDDDGATWTVVVTAEDGTTTATYKINVTVAPDTTAPEITAGDETVAIAALADWTETVSATDDVDGDISANVVATYFQKDGSTPLADLAAAKAYIDDASVNTSFVIKYNVSDAAGNAATEKVVTITVTP